MLVFQQFFSFLKCTVLLLWRLFFPDLNFKKNFLQNLMILTWLRRLIAREKGTFLVRFLLLKHPLCEWLQIRKMRILMMTTTKSSAIGSCHSRSRYTIIRKDCLQNNPILWVRVKQRTYFLLVSATFRRGKCLFGKLSWPNLTFFS
jgi:hypothetical protein